MLPRMPALTELRLPQNGIRPEGIAVLLRALGANPNLQVLDLQDNTFTAVGSKALAEVLPKWAHLKILNVGDCLLSSKVGVQRARPRCPRRRLCLPVQHRTRRHWPFERCRSLSPAGLHADRQGHPRKPCEPGAVLVEGRPET